MTCCANFVSRPRNVEELKHPAVSFLLPYNVVLTISLRKIDFQNFVTDMLVDRAFLENNVGLCRKKIPQDCILVVCRGYSWGILVVPEAGGFVGMAAVISKSDRPDLIKA